MQNQPVASNQRGNQEDHEYDAYIRRMQDRFMFNTQLGKLPLFTTDAHNLWEAYLAALPAGERQYHTCNCCRRFIETYGGLVTIDEKGNTTPAFWVVMDAPQMYRLAVETMRLIVSAANVTGVFVSSEREYGHHETGIWRHLALYPAPEMIHTSRTQTAFQKAAEKLQDFQTVQTALREYDVEQLSTVLRLLNSDALYRSEKVLGPAQWLHDLKESVHRVVYKERRDAIVWRAVATAPAGFCHPRTSMIGTLLDDVMLGMDFEQLAGRFKAKMHPLQYQRPQAAPKAGNIAAAEKLIEQLRAEGALNRRFCRLDEVEAYWQPRFGGDSCPKSPPENGVFSHLKPRDYPRKQAEASGVPTQTMTWEKFRRTILPTAEKLQYYVPSSGQNYGALVTAVDPNAPPILQWDLLERRNPVSWYVWHGGSHPSQFGLNSREFVDVEAITETPCHWYGHKHTHHGESAMLILKGAKDTKMAGAAIFPECLKSEFHGIRSVMEAYSRSATIAGLNQPHAAGLILRGKDMGTTLRVFSGGVYSDYKIDRWD